jgi:hypothetical protein
MQFTDTGARESNDGTGAPEFVHRLADARPAAGQAAAGYPLRDQLGVRPVEMPLAAPAPSVERAVDQPEAIGRIVSAGEVVTESRVLAEGFDWKSPGLQAEIDKLAERLWQDFRRKLKVERERARGWV